ncbi:P-loop containing nucleoside triphosphate hydrolase protein [Mycena latifolia]|nr:P-loop containing nucleoside triphosphate hydrolase protein [Mycena latifolia]
MPPNSESVVKPFAQRTVPMQVLGLGFPRTGTASLQSALETLGYVRTSHAFSVYASGPAVMDMWIAAIRAKFYGEGTPYGREEWDQLLGDCQAVTASPHVLFAAELIAAYPDAKVILTKRSPESWWRSYELTGAAQGQKPTLRAYLSEWLNPGSGKELYLRQQNFRALFGTTDVLTEDIAKARFTAHYDEVRRLVPKDRLLEFDLKEGWGPLVAFLGKEAPATAFPRVNDMEQYNERFAANNRAFWWGVASKIGGPFLAVVAAATMLMYVRTVGRV